MPIYDKEYRALAKRVNERIRQFEKRKMNSPAFLRIKAQLSMMDRKRFTETGRGETEKEIEQNKRLLEQFLNYKTSTIKGYREYRQKILDTSQTNYNYKAYGLSDDQWLDIWDKLDDVVEKKDRTWGSEVYIAIVEMSKRKANKEHKGIDIAQIVQTVESQETYKEAVESVGLSVRGVNRKIRSYDK